MATLTTGDISFISFNADEDGWAIVTFVDIDPNTTIYFTDNEATSSTAFNTGESYFQWISGASTISAGTVIRFSAVDSSTLLAASVGTLSRATVTNSSNYGLSATADIVYAFLGSLSSGVITVSNILTAVSSGDVATAGNAVSLAITNAGLTIGTNAILLRTSADYGEYSGSRTGQSNFSNYKSLVFDVANWTVDQTDATYTTTVPNTTAFTIAAITPTVNLSVSSNSGSEAGTTVITVTATASSAVTGNQTVNLGVTGTGITAGDYTLSNSSITILNGQTTGSVTFTVVDDVLVEGTETATLTISNPSTGIALGITTSQNITVTDNDVAANPTVNLSVSSNAGTEAGTTIITVTATASSAVSSNQTVLVGVSGTGITTSDYYLSNSIITISNGQTSGFVQFIVADDVIAEGTETATLTISNPSAGLSLGGTTTQAITITNNDNSFLTKVGGATSTNGAEISAFDSGSKRLFVVAGNTIEFYTVSTTGTLALAGSLTPTITPSAGTALIPNSVAVKNGVVAVAYAVQNTTTLAQQIGKVAFFNAGDGSFINAVDVGALPDMLTFTPDGTKVLVANEGEPNSYGQVNSIDPEGSISIINIAGGVASATVQTADFTNFNSQMATLKAAGVRITGPGSTVAQDLEPEYIAVSPDGLTATITLQENNAIAILDIASATITQILPLGAKNYNLPGNGIDASDQDSSVNGGINIQNWPVFGLYQPDAIASFSINGQAYYITANEGDSRNYTGFNEEIRVGAAGYVLDPTAFPNAATLKQNANLGRLQLTNATGDIDGDGDIDRIESFGARSFSIWNANGTQVFDSGDQLEQITAAKTPTLFNSDGTATTFNTRSDNKGPEPEGVVVGVINGRTYAFIGIERSGDVFVYDVTSPNQPTFVQYINTPEDTGAEGLTFISAADSPTGKPLLVTANEVSKTVAVFEVKVPTYIHAIQGSGTAATAGTFTIEGIVVGDFQGTNQLGGFYLQEEDTDADGNVLTSEGIFVNSLTAVNIGDKVRVTGVVAENSSTPSFNQAVITPSDVSVLATGQQSLVTATVVDLPTTVLGDLERYEGMLITIPEVLTVTEVFNLGRFGEISLSANGRLSNPTNIIDPNDNPASGTTSSGTSNVAAVTAQQDLNNRSRIILDDGSSASNLSDVPYIDTTDANPLNDTLRIGSTIAGLTGILGFGFNAYRIQATQAPTINYEARPELPIVGGSIKVGSFNVLNYFNGDGLGGGFPTSRGADASAEFSRQRAKIISAIAALNADVVGLIEMENDGDGPNSAIADLVNGLNALLGAGTYATIPLANTTGSSGTDEIKVAFIYKPSALTPVGNARYFNDSAFNTARPPLAQTFSVNATGEKFTPIVNHFKSKGSSAGLTGDTDQGDGQGLSNATRKAQSTALLNFVSQIQTASGDSDVMILGDLNAYNEEDPIDILRAGGFTKLTTTTDSYVFDGQTGSLDHALVTSSLLSQVTGAAKWNINSSEPIALDYNDNVQTTGTNGEQSSELRNDTTLYSASPFRSSDHDPVIVGLNLNTNAAPVFTSSNAVNVAENSTAVVDLTATDINLDPVTFTITGGLDRSLFNLTSGALSFKAAPNFEVPSDSDNNNVYVVQVAANDGKGGITNQTINITVDDINEAPTAVVLSNLPTSLEENLNTANRVKVADISIIDDAKGTNVLSLSGADASAFEIDGNALYLKANTSLDFETKSSYTFSVQVDDSTVGGTPDASATLSIAIANVNDAPVLTGTKAILIAGTEDTAYTIAVSDLLTGFTDADGNTLSITGLTATNGTLIDNVNGTYSFTPNANFNGSVNLSYNVVDGNGGVTAATQVVTITAVNDAPVLTGTKAILIAGTEDTTYTIAASDLLTGFTDADGNTLSITGLTATNGTLIDNVNGTYSFTPNANFNGSVNLSYNVVDGNGGVTAATQVVTIAAVNDSPVLTAGNLTRKISGNISQPITGISISDIDASATLNGTVQVTLSATKGVLTLGTTTGLTGSTSGSNITFSGTIATINNALATLNYKGNSNVFGLGADTITLTVNDQGNSGSGGSLSDSKAIALNIYNTQIGTNGNDIFAATPYPDEILAGGGNDRVLADVFNLQQSDIFDGGTGTDQLVVFGGTSSDSLLLNITDSGANLLTGLNGLSGTTINNFERFDFSNFLGNLTATGSSQADEIFGGFGNDVLNGGFGNDSLKGGVGNDLYIVDATGDLVTELNNEGTDTIQSSVNWTLGNNFENLTLTGSAISGTGNNLDNVIIGNNANNILNGGDGKDILDGGLGADSLIGGAGDDTFIVDNINDTISDSSGTDTVRSSVNWTLGNTLENLTLTGTGNINGTGNGLKNVIVGNTGDNTLDGGNNADSLIGGAGNDTYIVDNTNDLVTELANEGTDTVRSSVTYTLAMNVENLTLTGNGSINGTGNDMNNIIVGNSGNNILDGGVGADALSGGLGNDTYIIDNLGDSITEGLSQGTDLVKSSVTWTLAENLENLTLTGTSNINGTGNSVNNVIIGNDGNNTLSGGFGNDSLTGGSGSDILVGGNGNDTLFLGLNDGATDKVVYNLGDGNDGVNQFLRGVGGDILQFNGIAGIDLRTVGGNTQFLLGDGVAGNAGFSNGSVLLTLNGVTGFTASNINDNILAGSIPTVFQFS